jgi:hypothetical protein
MAENENNEAEIDAGEVNADEATPGEVNAAADEAPSTEGTEPTEAPNEPIDKVEIPEMARVTPLAQDLHPPRESKYSNAQFEQLRSDTDAVNSTLTELEATLADQLEVMYASSRRRLYLSSAMMIFISALLSWTWLNLHTAFRPENLANATANIVIDAIPNATDHLHILLIDGAPDIAETFSEHLTDSIPVFRELLSSEFLTTVEDLSNALASRAVETALSLPPTEEAETTISTIIRLDAALEEMYNSSVEDGSVAIRDDLLQRMSSMTATNELLESLREDGAPVAPEELLIGWLHIVSLATE